MAAILTHAPVGCPFVRWGGAWVALLFVIPAGNLLLFLLVILSERSESKVLRLSDLAFPAGTGRFSE
jgi:hypothetical protein